MSSGLESGEEQDAHEFLLEFQASLLKKISQKYIAIDNAHVHSSLSYILQPQEYAAWLLSYWIGWERLVTIQYCEWFEWLSLTSCSAMYWVQLYIIKSHHSRTYASAKTWHSKIYQWFPFDLCPCNCEYNAPILGLKFLTNDSPPPCTPQ